MYNYTPEGWKNNIIILQFTQQFRYDFSQLELLSPLTPTT